MNVGELNMSEQCSKNQEDISNLREARSLLYKCGYNDQQPVIVLIDGHIERLMAEFN